jgi:hypothetical protein
MIESTSYMLVLQNMVCLLKLGGEWCNGSLYHLDSTGKATVQ